MRYNNGTPMTGRLLAAPRQGSTGRFLAVVLYTLTTLIGVLAFLYPFLLPSLAPGTAVAPPEAALLTAVLVVLCLVALLVELQGQAVSAKMVAALGFLVAVASVLRFLETAVPGPGGFSPIFVPLILAGYVFGPRFGYLMGVLTLLVSALITAGLGPWLPYQMFVAGWVGAAAGWLPHPKRPGLQMAVLLVAAAVSGLLYGFLTNLYFWPFFVGDAAISYQAGQGVMNALNNYLAFYALTSLVWDLFSAGGNVLLVLALGRPAVHALVRFRDRFTFEPLPVMQEGA